MTSKLKLNRTRRTYAERFVLDGRMPMKPPGWCGSRRRALNALRFMGIERLRPGDFAGGYNPTLMAKSKRRWKDEGLTRRGR